jgi:hypothetical protein
MDQKSIELKAQAIVEAALELLEELKAPPTSTAIQSIRIAPPPFCSEFIEFLKTGDITALAPSGKMTPEMFKCTQHYVFADIIRVNGKTVQATFFSNPTKGLVLVSPELAIQVGKCVLINSKGVLTGYICQIPEFASRANTFNSLAARSKS